MSEKNVNQQLESDKTPLQGDEKECRYCSKIMPANASVCFHCRQSQTWWKNHIRIDHVGLLIALIMMIIALLQLQEARRERISAASALAKAEEAERKAQDTAKDIHNMDIKTKNIFAKLQKSSDEMQTDFLKVKKDTLAFNKYMDEAKAEMKVLRERWKKSFETDLAMSARATIRMDSVMFLHVPVEVAVVCVFLQKPNTLDHGSSELLECISRKDFTSQGKLKEYIKIAKSKEMKLVVTAYTADKKKRLQNEIIYKDKFLKSTRYRDPSQDITSDGGEIPLD